MYFASLLINVVYDVYPTKNKENVNIYLSLKFCYRRKNDVKHRDVKRGNGEKAAVFSSLVYACILSWKYLIRPALMFES